MSPRPSPKTDRSGVLLTAATEDSRPIFSLIDRERITLLHLPLESYVEADDREHEGGLSEALGPAENIIFGARRNAEFLLRRAQKDDLIEEARQRVNLAFDSYTVELLEEYGIPAVSPEGGRPIDLVELMLRLRRTGQALYPCGGHAREEIPGLLRELDIPVTEYVLYDLEGPTKGELKEYRRRISAEPPDLIICHSRRSVNRLRAAFPGLDYDHTTIVAGDRAVAEKLKEYDLSSDYTAEGHWESIAEIVNDALGL